MLFRQTLDQYKSRDRSGFMLAIIEEAVIEQLGLVIGYASWVLEQIDSTQRLLTHAGIAATIDGSDYLGKRTKAEQDESPNAGYVHMHSNESRVPVFVTRPRAALSFNRQELAEDLMVPLKRQYKNLRGALSGNCQASRHFY